MERTLRRPVSLSKRVGIVLIGVLMMAGIGAMAKPAPLQSRTVASYGYKVADWAWTQVGYGCGHYGWCGTPWCALWATDAWDHGGSNIPRYDAVSSIHQWAVDHGLWRSGWGAYHHPGDMVLYKDSWGNWAHVGVIVNGTGNGGDIRTIEGNWSSKVSVVGYFWTGNPGNWEPGYHIAGYVATLYP